MSIPTNTPPTKIATNSLYLVYECDDFGNARDLLGAFSTKQETKKFVSENIKNQASGWFWIADYTDNGFKTIIEYEIR